jgi:regulator of replication initiation timing
MQMSSFCNIASVKNTHTPQTVETQNSVEVLTENSNPNVQQREVEIRRRSGKRAACSPGRTQENKALKLELEDLRKELKDERKKVKDMQKQGKKEKEAVLERLREIEGNYQKYATYYSKFMDIKNQCDEKDEQIEELQFERNSLKSKLNDVVRFVLHLCR